MTPDQSADLLLQLPGFLELIVEHYRRCLIQIFGILEEYEVGAAGQKTLSGSRLDPPKVEEVLKEQPGAASESSRSPEEQKGAGPSLPALLLTAGSEEAGGKGEAVVKEEELQEPRPQQASKYDKLPIKLEKGEEWEEVQRRWAELNQPNGFISGLNHWRAGGGDSTLHIQTGESAPTEEEGGVRLEGEELDLPTSEETPSEQQEGEEEGNRSI